MSTRLSRTLSLFALLLCSGASFSQENSDSKEADEFAAKKPETKFTEVIVTDSMGASDLMKRATAWMTQPSVKYRKAGGTMTGSKAECLASFPVKPKELNPEVDYTGKITMKVMIECKNSRYRYTVSDIRHESKSGKTTAGSIDNIVPECGSVAMHEIVWKKLKAEALHNATLVVSELKEGMSADPAEASADDW